MRKILFLLLTVTVSFNAIGQVTQDELLEDIVTVVDNKFTASDYTLLKLSDGTSTLQIKSYAEAPSSGIISRDNFVLFFTNITMTIIEGLSNESGGITENLDELIGNPDITINIYMSKNGYQVETKTTEGTNRITQKWTDL